MKPLQFDLTPLAKALEDPGSKGKKRRKPKEPDRRARPVPARKSETALARVGVFPGHIAATAGWISALMKEQIHALATHALARHQEQSMRVLAITSAVAGEGKTTISLALAEKLGQAGKRVLIIDLDTHRGTLSRAAKLDEAEGALEVSAGGNGTAMPFHCYATDCKGVAIMPTGRVDADGNGVPVLEPERLQSLVRRALEDHDLVVLDCPPLLPVADTHIIGEIADSALLVVRARSTPREVLAKALEDFGKNRFFAAILNRASPRHIPYFREVYGYYRRDPAKK